jgi:hypothetical protein
MKPHNFGFKNLTLQNWKESDLTSITSGLQETDWIAAVLEPQLNSSVPEEIVKLFEVARSAFAYGWFFLPLMELGHEQCLRILETGVRERCTQLGISVRKKIRNGKFVPTSFKDNVAALVKAGIFSARDEVGWFLTRKVRNDASHPSSQAIIGPVGQLGYLISTVDRLNKLFPPSAN